MLILFPSLQEILSANSSKGCRKAPLIDAIDSAVVCVVPFSVQCAMTGLYAGTPAQC